MTDEALDLLARRVLLDALRSEWEHGNETTVLFMPSKKYQQQMRDMLADPQGWCKRKFRPMWKIALRRVAAFFLTALVGVSAWLAVDTQVREAFFGWVREAYEHSIIYRIMPTDTAQTLPHCELTYLPEGLGEPDTFENETIYYAFYGGNENGDIAVITYRLLDDTTQTEYLTSQQPQQVSVRGTTADFYSAESDADYNNLIWVETDLGIVCTIDSSLPKEEMLRIAEGMEFSREAPRLTRDHGQHVSESRQAEAPGNR